MLKCIWVVNAHFTHVSSHCFVGLFLKTDVCQLGENMMTPIRLLSSRLQKARYDSNNGLVYVRKGIRSCVRSSLPGLEHSSFIVQLKNLPRKRNWLCKLAGIAQQVVEHPWTVISQVHVHVKYLNSNSPQDLFTFYFVILWRCLHCGIISGSILLSFQRSGIWFTF